jgi:hypothetical protein
MVDRNSHNLAPAHSGGGEGSQRGSGHEGLSQGTGDNVTEGCGASVTIKGDKNEVSCQPYLLVVLFSRLTDAAPVLDMLADSAAPPPLRQ